VADFRALSATIAFTRGSGLPGRVWEANDLVWVTDLASSNFPRAVVAESCGLQAGFAFPIILAGKFAGVMEFFTVQKRERDDALMTMLAPLGIQIGQLIERKRAEEGLREAMRQQKAILNNIPDMVWLKDTGGKFTAVNEAFGQICGLSPEQVVGRGDQDIWDAELADLYTRNEKIVLQTRSRNRTEEPGLETQGAQLVVETIRSPVLNERGEIVGITGIARDITERKRMEEALAASEANYRTIFDGANDPILVHDPATGAILDVNRKMCQMYGYTAEEARNCTVADLSGGSSPFTAETALEQLAKAAAGEVRIFEWLARHRNGYLFWVEVNLKSAVIGGEERILAVIRDITERKRLEAELVAMALHDSLTGLPNRNLLQDRLAQVLAAAGRNGTGAALIFIDLDGFKQINDSHGHPAGDEVLKEFSSILLRCVRESDTVARFGGDEFIAVLSSIRGREDAMVVAQKIVAALESPLLIDGMEISLGASIGIALYPQDGADLEALIRSADAEMYRSKQLGKEQAQPVVTGPQPG
jgi:diguanylate cyclase (GGDEF)-like protein/PAS domain S-box-containing protein